MVWESCEFRVKSYNTKSRSNCQLTGDRTLSNSRCDRLEEELSKLVTSALLNLGAGKHYPSAGQAFLTIHTTGEILHLCFPHTHLILRKRHTPPRFPLPLT